MEGLWDKITGKDDHKDAPHQPTTQMTSATNPVATESQTRTNPIKQDNPSSSPFSFDKLKEALGGHSSGVKTPDLPPPVTVTQVEHSGSQGKDDWHDKFRDLLDIGASNKREAEEERARLERAAAEAEVAARVAEEKATVKGKLKGIFQSDSEEAAEHQRLVEEALAKRREAEEARRKEHSVSAKIKDVFDHDSEEKERERQRLAEEAKRNQSFGARVRKIFDHDEPVKVQEKKHPWSRTPTPEPKPDWKDKLNNLTGGGAKAEAKEDKIDKAIDLWQEHVLHDGQQKNESALEQAKDKQIAAAIREGLEKATGHEFKDKGH